MSATALVVGGGWSGISAAWYLTRAGYEVTVLDSAPRPGGRSATAWLGAQPVTLGGKNIGARYHEFRSFAADMGVTDFEHFGLNSSRLENGKVVSVSGSSKLRSVAGYLKRTPPRDIWRFASMARLIRSDEHNRFLGGEGFAGLAERTGDPALSELFGTYLRQNLIRPMTVRMNGAEPDEIHVGTFGTNLALLLDSTDQLTGGFEPLFAALTDRVSWTPETVVTALVVDDDRVTGVTAEGPGGTRELAADVTVVAVPGHAAAELTSPVDKTLTDLLREIHYFPAAVAIAEYAEPVFTPEVRGLVFPPSSPLSNAGAYGADDRHIVRYTFSGRAARRLLADGPSSEELAAMGEAALNPHFRVSTRENLTGASWPAGFCAYGPGSLGRVRQIEELVAARHGLALTGDYLRGASVEACFRASKAAVARVPEAANA
jgi:protoporphyrinogen/coproporphyrinogen III oxidase